MKDDLTKDQIAFYRENGFLVIESFLDRDELSHWQKTTQEAVDQRIESNGGLSNHHDPESYYSQVFLQCIKLADTHAGMWELILDPRLGKLAATLAGVDGIRIWHDQA